MTSPVLVCLSAGFWFDFSGHHASPRRTSIRWSHTALINTISGGKALHLLCVHVWICLMRIADPPSPRLFARNWLCLWAWVSSFQGGITQQKKTFVVPSACQDVWKPTEFMQVQIIKGASYKIPSLGAVLSDTTSSSKQPHGKLWLKATINVFLDSVKW